MIFSIDSSAVRAHQHAAGARKKGGSRCEWVEALAIEGAGLGRSRGGLTSKIHLAVDGRGLPMSILITPGQAGDNPNCCRCSTRSASPEPGEAGPASDPIR